jgi:hypothetical protein
VVSWRICFLQERTEKVGVIKPQRMTIVLIRLGTSPTGMIAIICRVAVAITETERLPEFDT